MPTDARIDLRSDTVTKPGLQMRQCMANAEVGDDVFGDDPTVASLERLAAEMTGHEAALFVTSGTQGNLAALLTHVGRGDGVILGRGSHIYNYERGGLAALGGLLPLVVDDPKGIPDEKQVEAWCRPENVHFAPARLLCLENTHNREGGRAIPPEDYRRIIESARQRGLRLHLDGARVCNAAVRFGVDVREYTACVDSVQLCLSKGLGAPMGSMLCGSHDFIRAARHWRKALGGGTRQVGIVAAAGIYVLEHMVTRLFEDHANAALLSSLLRQAGLDVREIDYPTNMVYLACPGKAKTLADRCEARDVLFTSAGADSVRLVTHLDVSKHMVEQAAAVIIEEGMKI